MNSKEIKEKVDQGYLHINVLFEIVGSPKEHVIKALDLVMDEISKQKGVIIISQEKGEPEDAGEGMWGTFCEAEILVNNILTLSWLAFNFVPASIEIKAPGKLTIKDKEMTDFLGDIIAQLHQTNAKLVQTNSNNMNMLKNLNAVFRNLVLVALNQQEKTAAELAKHAGIDTKEMEKLLDAMIQEKTVEKKGTKFKALVKK